MKEREKTVFAILAILMILVFGPLKRSDQNEIMLIKIKNIENKLDSLIKN